MNYEDFSERLRELFQLMEEQGLAAVFVGLHKTRKRMVVTSAREADQMIPGATAVFLQVLDGLE
jgi:hypothetical protein